MGVPLWLDTPDRPAPRPALDGDAEVDLAIVGGGFTGLWTALRAVERTPGLRVLLIEADRIAEHATGRNGGFCEATLTHGEANGRERWPDEYDALHRLGLANLDAIESTVGRYGIDCGWARGGALAVATRSHEVAALQPAVEGFLDAEAVRRMVDSPTYLAGRHEAHECALVDPARLAWGLAAAAEGLGVRIVEQTRVTGIREGELTTSRGTVRAAQVALATNAFPPLLRRLRLSTVPVYDYVLATEPLDRRAAGRAAVGPGDRDRRLGQPVPLLPDHARPPDPLGRVRRDLPLPPRHRPGARGPAGDVRGARASTSSRRSRSSRASGSPTAGRASSIRRPGSARSTAPPMPAGRRTPSGSPGSVSGPRGSPPT